MSNQQPNKFQNIKDFIIEIGKTTSFTKSWLANSQAALFMGVALGIAATFGFIKYWEVIESWQPLLAGAYAFGILILSVIILIFIFFRKPLFKSLLKVKLENYDTIANEIAEETVLPLVKRIIPEGSKEEVEKLSLSIERFVRQIFAYQIYSSSRRVAFGWLIGLVLGLAGYLGTTLTLKQNRLIKEQTLVTEATRRSSLMFMMNEIMTQVNEELKGKSVESYHKSRKLTPQTIARLAALSYSLYPYRFMSGDTLETKPISPERGQLLLNLLLMRLDTTETMTQIFKNCTFEYADLRNTDFNNFFIKNAKLGNSNFTNASIKNIEFVDSDLTNVDFNHTKIVNSRFYGIQFDNRHYGISFINVEFDSVTFKNCDFHYGPTIEHDKSFAHFQSCAFTKNLFDHNNSLGFYRCTFSKTIFKNNEWGSQIWFLNSWDRDVSEFKGMEIDNISFISEGTPDYIHAIFDSVKVLSLFSINTDIRNCEFKSLQSYSVDYTKQNEDPYSLYDTKYLPHIPADKFILDITNSIVNKDFFEKNKHIFGVKTVESLKKTYKLIPNIKKSDFRIKNQESIEGYIVKRKNFWDKLWD